MLSRSVVEKCCGEVLSRSVVAKCCREEVLSRSVVEKCCQEVLSRSAVEKCYLRKFRLRNFRYTNDIASSSHVVK